MENNERMEDFDGNIVENEDITTNQDQEAVETEILETEQESKKFCKHCGKELEGELKFCPNCGKPCETMDEVHYCRGCGEKIDNNVKFCPKCGTKVVTKIDINLSGADGLVKKVTNRFSAKKAGIVLGAIALLCILVVVGINVIPRIFVSPYTLMEEGNYEKAYTKANKDDKEKVLIENLLANLCRDAEDGLKDPSSFKLRDAWYEAEDGKRIVLYISGKNSMGGMANSYWLYTYNSSDKEYKLFTSINDMEKEEAKSYDDTDEKLEKILNNLSRDVIKDIYVDSNKQDKDLIERINGLHDKDMLKNVELLDEVESIYPTDDDSDDNDDAA